MANKVQFYECYDYNEELLLIEMLVDDSSDNIDWGEFTAPEKGIDKDDWQCAYLEQYLNVDGTEKICELYDEPDPEVKPCRFAFFIYRYPEQEKRLLTPYGEFSLENPKPMPKRLIKCIEFDNEEDDD